MTVPDLNYQIVGDPSQLKIVFLHGLMGSLSNWRKVVSNLQAVIPTAQCLIYDQRGHGRSFHAPGRYAPEDYAQDLLNLTEFIKWDSFVLVGHSMGGRNALCFASQYPNKVQGLIIEDIGPEAFPQAHLYYQYLLDSVPTPFVSREAAKQYLYKDFIAKIQSRERPEVLAAFFYSNLDEQPDGSVDWRFHRQGIIDSVIQGREQDRWQDLENLKCPSLLIRGALSKELSQKTYLEMLQRQPLMRGVEIPEAGHWVHSDQTSAFVQTIEGFISKL